MRDCVNVGTSCVGTHSYGNFNAQRIFFNCVGVYFYTNDGVDLSAHIKLVDVFWFVKHCSSQLNAFKRCQVH